VRDVVVGIVVIVELVGGNVVGVTVAAIIVVEWKQEAIWEGA
jgi:hypothetical protein